jgi:ParB-like chromosome segregation protein Spo0J
MGMVGSDGVIFSGHGRLAAAQRLGLSSLPVVAIRVFTNACNQRFVLICCQ